MNVKRWLRGPWLWVVLFAVLVLVVLDVVSNRSGYKDVDTSSMIKTLQSGDVTSVTFIDGDQEIQATTKDGQKISAQWLAGQGVQLVDMVQKDVQNGTIDGTYDVQVPKPSLLWSFLSGIFPILLVVLFFLFMMNSLQGGGGRVMQFAKSKAKLVSKDTPEDHVRRRRGLRRGDRGAWRDQGVPPAAGQVPGGRRQDPQGRAALRSAWHRQDAARPRRRR